MDGRENMFVYGSGSGVPCPWQEVSMSMLAGNLWILSSYVIRRGGAVPRDAPAGSTRIIAFVAIATRRVDYETTVLIIPPPWAEAPAQQPSPPSQRTTKAGQFDISTSMLFLTDPKYHVRIVHGLKNYFPNTMFGGVLLWTLIEVMLRNMRSLYALWRQKTPLTNGRVQEAKTHCRKIGEAWLPLGWKSTPWVHWTMAHCGAVLQKYRNLYVFSSIPAEHRHKPFKLAVKNSMRGWCLRRPRVSRRGLTHVLNMETLDVGLRYRAARQRLALGEATRERRKRHCMYA